MFKCILLGKMCFYLYCTTTSRRANRAPCPSTGVSFLVLTPKKLFGKLLISNLVNFNFLKRRLHHELNELVARNSIIKQTKLSNLNFHYYIVHFVVMFSLLLTAHYFQFIFVFVLFVSAFGLEALEKDLISREKIYKLRNLVAQLDFVRSSPKAIPFEYKLFEEIKNESFKIYRTIRDGFVVQLPEVLLVAGDAILLSKAEDVDEISDFLSPTAKSSFLIDDFLNEGLLEACVVETPVIRRLEAILKVDESKARCNYMNLNIERVMRLVLSVQMFICVLAFARGASIFHVSVGMLLSFPPVWVFILRLYSNARIQVLWSLLKVSKKTFDDIDEFDEDEPPPTIDLNVPFRLVVKQMHAIVTGRNPNLSLFDNLSLVSFITYTDRAGTLCSTYPVISKILFFSEQAIVDKAVVLDLVYFEDSSIGIQFEDRGWMLFTDSLKPVGLAVALLGTCRLSIDNFTHRRDHSVLVSSSEWSKVGVIEQLCPCSIAKLIGFESNDLHSFELVRTFYIKTSFVCVGEDTRDNFLKNIFLTLKAYQETASGNAFLFCEGHPDFVLDFCTGYFNGTSIETFCEKSDRNIEDFYQSCCNSDTLNTAIGFKKIALESVLALGLDGSIIEVPEIPYDQSKRLRHSVTYRKENDLLFKVLDGLVFLSLLGISFEPKQSVSSFIDDLEQAGIRFVYFSPSDQKSTKAFGERLGLETNWNSCIILSEPFSSSEQALGNNGKRLAKPTGYSDISDINTRLPQGPTQIKMHIQDVDDIPLHVSLFADAHNNKGFEICELFDIFVQQGETVCSIGNCLNTLNIGLFAAADVGIGMKPRAAILNGPMSQLTSLQLACQITSVFCHLNDLAFNTSPYVFTEIIQESRAIFISCNNILNYLLSISTSFSLLIAVKESSLLVSHNPFLCFFLFLPILFIAVSLAGISCEQSLMKNISPKRNDSLIEDYTNSYKRRLLYFFFKTASILVCLFVMPNIYAVFFFILLSSMFYTHRILSIFSSFQLIRGKFWLFQIVIGLFFKWLGGGTWRLLPCLLFSMFIHELCKKHDKTYWLKTQKRWKLEFNTRLGMHSPV